MLRKIAVVVVGLVFAIAALPTGSASTAPIPDAMDCPTAPLDRLICLVSAYVNDTVDDTEQLCRDITDQCPLFKLTG